MLDGEDSLSDIKVLIADDHAIFRMGLASLLKQITFIGKISEAQNGLEVLKILETDHYDVLLLDIEMPGKNGIETLRELRKYNEHVKVLPLSMFSNETYLTEMYESGANGYLLKNTNKKELKRALELLMEGESYYTPEVAGKLFKALANKNKTFEQNTLELTEREREIILLICQQWSSAEIAEKLFLSENTIKKHRQNLFEKLKVKNTAGVVIYAIKNNIFCLE